MEAAANIYNLLGIPSHQCLFSAEIKHGYWAVNVHPDDHHYLTFYVPGIGQVQPTHMSQGARTSVFIFGEPMNIILEPIPSPKPEPSLFHVKTPKDSALLAFYMNDIFGTFKTYQKQYIFLHDHFFPHMVWSKPKLAFSKLKIGMTKIFALGEEYEIGRRIRLKSDKIEKILIWPIPKDQTAVRAFLDTIQSTKHWVLGFTKLTRLLICLTGKAEWQWTK